MKNNQQQQAKNLYFQTNLNKSQIAETLGVNRRTIMLWVQQGNWDRLKLSSQHLPSMVVEKCYYMLNHYLDNLLSANAVISTFGPKEAAAINQLATSIKKIRTRSAVNESMEMMTFFLEDVRRKDPEMAEAMRPFVEQYLANRKDVNLADFLPQNFNEDGFLNYPIDDLMESRLDEEEQEKIDEDFIAWKAKRAAARQDVAGEQKPGNQSDGDSGPVNPQAQPPVIVSPSNYTPPHRPIVTPNDHTTPTLTDYKSRSQASKLTPEIEKQLTQYLKHQNKVKVAA